MMSEIGKKRNIKIFSAVIAAIFVFSVAGLAIMQTGNPVNAAPSSNIGVVDTSKIITPDNQDAVAAQKQLQQAGEDMQKQFEQQSAGMDDQQKQQLFQKMQGELATKRQEIFLPANHLFRHKPPRLRFRDLPRTAEADPPSRCREPAPCRYG